MQLRQMIEAGSIKAGNQELLAKAIGTSGKHITEAKAGRRGLPAFACFKLAELIEVDVQKVIAASELVTEKNEDKRAFFAPFVLNGIAPLASALAVLSLSLAPNETYANDTTFVTKAVSQHEDSTTCDNQKTVIWIMRSYIQGAGLP